MRLAAMQKFDPIVRLMRSERERFPELEKTFTTDLELDQWQARMGGASASRDRDGGPGRVRAALTTGGQSLPRSVGG